MTTATPAAMESYSGSALALASARTTFGTMSSIGIPWMLDCEGLAQIYATDFAPDFVNGVLRFQPGGKFAVELGDLEGWFLYSALTGIEEGRPVRVTGWYGFDSAPITRVDQANFDAQFQGYTNLGPMSDGSLGGNQAASRIIVEVTDGLEWTITGAHIGWVQP